jgi:alpha-glucuronidase
MRLFLISFFFLAAAKAFTPPFANRHVSTKLHRQQLNDMDLMCIENVANLCTQADSALDGCDVDQYEAMTNQLKDQRAIIQEQRAIMQTHLDEIDGILARLAGDTAVAAQ